MLVPVAEASSSSIKASSRRASRYTTYESHVAATAGQEEENTGAAFTIEGPTTFEKPMFKKTAKGITIEREHKIRFDTHAKWA